MDPMRIGLLDLAERRLAWTDRRQAVLAQNIANANTPRYQPHDVRPFAATIARSLAVAPVRTQPNHLPGTAAPTEPSETVDRSHTQAPDGNGVVLDEQLVKVASTEMTHSLAATIYRKYLSMFGTALGRSASG